MKSETLKRAIAVLAGILSSVLLLLFGELFFILNKKQNWITKNDNESIHIFDEYVLEEHLKLFDKKKYRSLDHMFNLRGYNHKDLYTEEIYPKDVEWESFSRLRANQKFKSKLILKRNGSHHYIFNVYQTIDSYGRRLTPSSNDKGKRQIIFLGGSFVYGEGLEDSETLPHYVCTNLKNYSCYNHGVAAGGASKSLYYVNNDIHLGGIDQNKKLDIIYVFMDGHIYRALGSNSWIKAAPEQRIEEPMYVLDKGKIVYMGSFDNGMTGINRLFYEIVDNSELLSFFNIDYPLYLRSKHFNFYSKLLLEIKKSMSKKYNIGNLVVLFYPGSKRYADKLIPILQDLKIKTLNYSELNLGKIARGRSRIPFDGHPTSFSNFILGKIFSDDYKKID